MTAITIYTFILANSIVSGRIYSAKVQAKSYSQNATIQDTQACDINIVPQKIRVEEGKNFKFKAETTSSNNIYSVSFSIGDVNTATILSGVDRFAPYESFVKGVKKGSTSLTAYATTDTDACSDVSYVEVFSNVEGIQDVFESPAATPSPEIETESEAIPEPSI